ncbi:transposase [bacterium]|nr:transposase [bacterium]
MGKGVYSFKDEEFQIVEKYSPKFGIEETCSMVNVSLSGFYKWRSITRHHYRIRREELIADVKRVHEAHKTHGYRWIANYLRQNEGKNYSDGMVYKAWHYLGLKCESRHQPKKRKKVKKSNKNVAPNLIYSTWDTVDRPRRGTTRKPFPIYRRTRGS